MILGNPRLGLYEIASGRKGSGLNVQLKSWSAAVEGLKL